MEPGTSYTTFLLVAALAGVGGGNFASSMTNINAFFPLRKKGWALGLNAGGGNIGVPVVQLVGLLVIATAGRHPPARRARRLPAADRARRARAPRCGMDNLAPVRNDTGAAKEALRDAHTWIMAFLYVGTFGSFIGYSFAFGLVLQTQFGRTPLQAASLTFIGPLLGSADPARRRPARRPVRRRPHHPVELRRDGRRDLRRPVRLRPEVAAASSSPGSSPCSCSAGSATAPRTR